MVRKHRRHLVALVLGVLCVCGVCPSVGSTAEPSDQTTVLVAYRIEGHPDQVGSPSLKDNPTIEAYPILGIKFLTSPAEVRRLAGLVAAERKASRNPSVCFYPGFALSFLSRDTVSSVLICLECRNLSGARADEVVGMSDSGYEQFLAVYNELFKGVTSQGAR